MDLQVKVIAKSSLNFSFSTQVDGHEAFSAGIYASSSHSILCQLWLDLVHDQTKNFGP